MLACRVKSSDMRYPWKAFLKRKARERALNVTTKTKFRIERTSASRYLTFHKNQCTLATLDPKTREPWIGIAREFVELKTDLDSRDFGSDCWTDRFLRSAMSLPSVLPAMTVVRDMLNFLLLLRLKIPFRDEAAADPTFVPRMLARCHKFLKRVKVDAENGNDTRLELLFKTGMPKHVLSDTSPTDPENDPTSDEDAEEEAVEEEEEEGEEEEEEEVEEEGLLDLDEESATDAAAGDEAVRLLNMAGVQKADDLREFREVVEAVKLGWTADIEKAFVRAMRFAVVTEVIAVYGKHQGLLNVSKVEDGKWTPVDVRDLSDQDRARLMVATYTNRKGETQLGDFMHIIKSLENRSTRANIVEGHQQTKVHNRRYPLKTLAALAAQDAGLYAKLSSEATKLHAHGGYTTHAQIGEEKLGATDVEKQHEWARVRAKDMGKAAKRLAQEYRAAAEKATQPVVDAINVLRLDKQYIDQIQAKDPKALGGKRQLYKETAKAVGDIVMAELAAMCALKIDGFQKNRQSDAHGTKHLGAKAKCELVGELLWHLNQTVLRDDVMFVSTVVATSRCQGRQCCRKKAGPPLMLSLSQDFGDHRGRVVAAAEEAAAAAGGERRGRRGRARRARRRQRRPRGAHQAQLVLMLMLSRILTSPTRR